MRYKDFSIPRDILLFTRILFGYIKFNFRVKNETTNDIVKKIKRQEIKMHCSSANSQDYFIKIYKASSFFSSKIFRNNKPCLIRSFIIFKEALKMGQDVKMVIGIKKKGTDIEGHSWIYINDKLLYEKAETIQEYTIMKEY